MKNFIAVIVLFLSGMSCLVAQDSDTVDLTTHQEAALAALTAYRGALVGDIGEMAAGLVSKGTLDYYDRLRKAALYADSAEVAAESIFPRLLIFVYRRMCPLDTLRATDREELFSFAVRSGWIDHNVCQVTFDTPQISGSVATFSMLVDEVPAGRLIGVLEENVWKIDLTSVIPAAEKTMKAEIAAAGYTESEALEGLIEYYSGKPFTPDLWDPLIRAEQ